MLEKHAGKLPTWLCPEQVRILPVSEKFAEYAKAVYAELRRNGVDVTVDDSSERIGYKIRAAQMEKIPYMLVVGGKEAEDKTVSVRSRFAGDEGVKPLDEFVAAVCEEIRTKEFRQETKEEKKEEKKSGK